MFDLPWHGQPALTHPVAPSGVLVQRGSNEKILFSNKVAPRSCTASSYLGFRTYWLKSIGKLEIGARRSDFLAAALIFLAPNTLRYPNVRRSLLRTQDSSSLVEKFVLVASTPSGQKEFSIEQNPV